MLIVNKYEIKYTKATLYNMKALKEFARNIYATLLECKRHIAWVTHYMYQLGR
jgi:hypothetical protein